MYRVIVLATSPKTRGGISSVIKSHRKGAQWKSFHCIWISTHIDRSVLSKLLLLVLGFLRYLFFLPFADVIHIHISEWTTAQRKLPFYGLAKLLKKKVIIHFHSFSPETTINGPYSGLYRKLFCGSDAVIVLSNYWKEVVDEKYHLGNRIRVIYNPCMEVEFTEKFDKTNSVLYAGALNDRKGYADLLHSFATIAKKYPNWKIVFAGNGEVEKACAMSKKLGISNQTEFLGWVDGESKHKAYSKAQIFCLPSYAEGFPMAVLDAWAYGLPVITTPVGGIPDIALDGENMLLFKPGDIKTLSYCLERMIADNFLREKISIASKELAATTFNVDTINQQIGDLYAELLNDKSY